MINLIAFSDDPLCVGYVWQIHDVALLASVLAELVMGDHIHAAEVLTGIAGEKPKRTKELLDQAIAEIAKPPASEPERYHRDGWLFQLISWTAARTVASPQALIKAPPPIKTQKGFDGIIVDIAAGSPSSLVICEDKATENPRHMITSKVWPEFTEIEARERDRELNSEVSTLLLQLPAESRKAVAEEVFWKERKHFRIAITASDSEASPDARRDLFEGFDACVSGDPLKRRRAEVISIPSLREWMDGLCALIVVALENMRKTASV